MPRPRVIYAAKPGSPLEVDRELYGRLAGEAGRRTLVERFIVPMRSGRAWPVRAGQLFRIVAVEGAPVADFNAWSLGNPRERFWAARTKQLHRAHVTTYDRLRSSLPYLRPMLTITNDTIRYGRDADGAGGHGLPRTRSAAYAHNDYHSADLKANAAPGSRGGPRPPRLRDGDKRTIVIPPLTKNKRLPSP